MDDVGIQAPGEPAERGRNRRAPGERNRVWPTPSDWIEWKLAGGSSSRGSRSLARWTSWPAAATVLAQRRRWIERTFPIPSTRRGRSGTAGNCSREAVAPRVTTIRRRERRAAPPGLRLRPAPERDDAARAHPRRPSGGQRLRRHRRRPRTRGSTFKAVYPPAKVYGGPGRFGFDERAHLTEASPLVGEGSRERLLAAWSPHWDLSRPTPGGEVAAEPAQDPLPPGAVPGGVVRGARAPPGRGLARHGEMAPDAALRPPRRALASLPRALRGRPPAPRARPRAPLRGPRARSRQLRSRASSASWASRAIRRAPISIPGPNRRYFERWRALRGSGLFWRAYFPLLTARYERRTRRFGYSLRDLERADGWARRASGA